jgi:hypothetical protein
MLPPLPPEQEKESSFILPVLSGRWVWSANPLSDRVAVIDTRGLSVKLARAGFGPTYLAALGHGADVDSAAIVLNAKSHSASIMRLAADTLSVQTVPTHSGANSWAVSPSGAWAIAWGDASAVTNPDPADSFQDITVIDARSSAATATRLSVGYRPSRIFFDSDESHAFVVSQAGISVVDLMRDGPSVGRDVPLATSATEVASDVSVVPDGKYALFRVEGSARVGIVELESGRRSDVTLSGPVTDLDLVADGSAAIAVVRGRPPTSSMGVGAGQAGSSGAGAIAMSAGGAPDSMTAGDVAGATAGGAGGAGGVGGVGASEGSEAGAFALGGAGVSGVSAAGAGGGGGASGQTTPPAYG